MSLDVKSAALSILTANLLQIWMTPQSAVERKLFAGRLLLRPDFLTSRARDQSASGARPLGRRARKDRWVDTACECVSESQKGGAPTPPSHFPVIVKENDMDERNNSTHPKFGRWTVESEAELLSSSNKTKVLCICECGTIKMVQKENLISGKTKSCGCLRKEAISARSKTHGESNTDLYGLYRSMISRCFNNSRDSYKYYGGRGITVCERWLGEGGYNAFKQDMGVRPDGYSLDRIDPNGNYEPSNCRWASKETQAINKNIYSSSKTGVKGITIDNGKFVARIGINKTMLNLGTFSTIEEAIAARRDAEIKHNRL